MTQAISKEFKCPYENVPYQRRIKLCCETALCNIGKENCPLWIVIK